MEIIIIIIIITKSSYQNYNFKIKAKLAIEYLANSAAYPVHLPSTGLRRQTAGKIASNCPANVGNHKPQYGQRMAGAQISVSQRLLRYHWLHIHIHIKFKTRANDYIKQTKQTCIRSSLRCTQGYLHKAYLSVVISKILSGNILVLQNSTRHWTVT